MSGIANVWRTKHLLVVLALALLSGACVTSAPVSAPAATQPAPAAAQPTAAAKTQAPAATQPAAAAATQPAQPAAASSTALYDAAKAEAKVVYYSSDETTQFANIHDAFMAHYPGIEVAAQEGRGQDARERIIAEQVGKRVIADVVIAGGNTLADLIDAGYLDQYQSPEVENLVPGIADKRGYANPRVVNVYGITFNADILPAADQPKRWKDLADPKYADKIAAQDPRGSGGGMYILTGLMEKYGDSFIQDLTKQRIFFSQNNGALVSDISRGEHSLLITASTGQVAVVRKDGAPVKIIHPEEGVVLIPISMAVVKNGPHPNAARLFIDWMLSEEGQKVVAANGDTPSRAGVHAREPEGDLTGVTVLTMNYDGTDRKLTADLSKKWEGLFFKTN
jgi:iron(III) transport system substrate-binding protein